MIKWWCLIPLMMIKNKIIQKDFGKERKVLFSAFFPCYSSFFFYVYFSLLFLVFFLPFIHIVGKLLLFLPFILFFLIESLWIVSRRLEMIMTMVNKKLNISFFLHGVRHATLSIGMIFFLVQRRVNINNKNVMACKKKSIFYVFPFLFFLLNESVTVWVKLVLNDFGDYDEA